MSGRACLPGQQQQQQLTPGLVALGRQHLLVLERVSIVHLRLFFRYSCYPGAIAIAHVQQLFR
jgi:hypothetical protein